MQCGDGRVEIDSREFRSIFGRDPSFLRFLFRHVLDSDAEQCEVQGDPSLVHEVSTLVSPTQELGVFRSESFGMDSGVLPRDAFE